MEYGFAAAIQPLAGLGMDVSPTLVNSSGDSLSPCNVSPQYCFSSDCGSFQKAHVGVSALLFNSCRGYTVWCSNLTIVVLKDRHDDAYKAIEYLHYDPDDPQQILAKEEYYAMVKQSELDRAKGDGSYKELFTVPANRKRVLLGFITLFGAQCTATIVINNYGIILYTALGYEAPTTLAFTAGWVTVCIGGNAVTALFVDRVGRVRFLRKFSAPCIIPV